MLQSQQARVGKILYRKERIFNSSQMPSTNTLCLVLFGLEKLI